MKVHSSFLFRSSILQDELAYFIEYNDVDAVLLIAFNGQEGEDEQAEVSRAAKAPRSLVVWLGGHLPTSVYSSY